MDGQSVKKQKRIDYVDLFRAFGIILMIMGHIGFGSKFNRWYHAFHMPMFFFISGWFYKSRKDASLKSQIIKKARSLLIPYICFELIVLAVCFTFIPEYRTLNTFQYVFWENTYYIPVEYGTNGISPIPGAMWFLTALFNCELIYILMDRMFHQKWKLHLFVFLIAVIGMIAAQMIPFRLPWAMDASFVGVGLFHTGHVVKGTKAEKLLYIRWRWTLLLGIVISVLIMFNKPVNMRLGNYEWYPLFWINALGAIVAGWNLSRYTEKLLKKTSYFSYIAMWLKGVGKNSIVYLCLNQIVIISAIHIVSLLGVKGFLMKFLILILTMFILFCFEKLICNTKAKVLIGK